MTSDPAQHPGTDAGVNSPQPVGWNTWDVRYHTGVVHLPTGLRVRFGIGFGESVDDAIVDGFTWRRGLERLGPHAVDGSYAEVAVAAAGVELELRFASQGDELVASASVSGEADVVLVVDALPGLVTGGIEFGSAPAGPTVEVAGRPWQVSLSRPAAVMTSGSNALWLRMPAGADALRRVRVASPSAGNGAAEVDARLEAAREAVQAGQLRTEGWLDDAGNAYVRSVTWNTVYAPDVDRVLTPTSRDFVSADRDGFYGTWAIHAWDTFFTALVAAWIDPAYARGIVGQVLEHATLAGMLPNRVSDDRGSTDDRSQPPVGATTVLKAYLGSGLSETTRDRSLLTGTYPALRRWNSWWLDARRGPFGLLAWGSDPVPGDPESATLDRTKRESGLDDSPMYDAVGYDPATHTMDLADVGLNALHVADTHALAEIARRLGDPDESAELRAMADASRVAIDDTLWSDEHDGYRNRHADGRFSDHVSPTLLYPLLGGIPSATRARQVVDQLLDPDVLGGEPPMPSVARNDPGYSTRYWRGRIWAPMVYLAVEGLRRYAFDDEARAVVRPLFDLYLHEWHAHSHVRENYPAQFGEDVRALDARSDGLMSWGSLLAYLAFTELADPRPDGWRFAHPGVAATLADLPLADGRLTVAAAERWQVRLDDELLLDGDPHVAVAGYVRDPAQVAGVATATGDSGRIAVAPPSGSSTVELTVRNSAPVRRDVRSGQTIEIDVPADGAPTPFRLRGDTRP